MGTKVFSNQRVTVLAGVSAAITDYDDPPLSELAALKNISGAVNWNSFDLNLRASTQGDDRTLTDAAGAQSRNPYTNFGGTLELVNPKPDDLSSIYREAYTLMSTPRVELVVAVRYGPLNSTGPQAGDEWTIYHLIVDPVAFGKNDMSHFYRVTLVARDDVNVKYIVPSASPATIVQTILDASVGVGDLVFVSAEYEGWDITKRAGYVISNQALLEEVHPGIFLAKAAGAPTVKATYPGATDSTAGAITITA